MLLFKQETLRRRLSGWTLAIISASRKWNSWPSVLRLRGLCLWRGWSWPPSVRNWVLHLIEQNVENFFLLFYVITLSSLVCVVSGFITVHVAFERLSLFSSVYEDCTVFRKMKAPVSIDWVLFSPVGRCVRGKVITLLLPVNHRIIIPKQQQNKINLCCSSNYANKRKIFKFELLWLLTRILRSFILQENNIDVLVFWIRQNKQFGCYCIIWYFISITAVIFWETRFWLQTVNRRQPLGLNPQGSFP